MPNNIVSPPFLPAPRFTLRQLHYFWPTVVGGTPPRVLDSKGALLGQASSSLKLGLDTAALRDAAAEIEWRKVSRLSIDAYARALADQLTRQTGGTFLVDNRSGASGNSSASTSHSHRHHRSRCVWSSTTGRGSGSGSGGAAARSSTTGQSFCSRASSSAVMRSTSSGKSL